MASDKKYKKDKEIVCKFECSMKDIHQQLNEQLRCLDGRVETHDAMLQELQEFYRHRSALELDYSQKLDRLVKQIMTRHKTEKQRRESWPGYSTYTCWQSLLESTMRQSKDHAILSDLYGSQMTNRFSSLVDDMHRIYRKCHDIAVKSHNEIVKVLNELQSALKTYHVYHSESKQAESKLRSMEQQKSKLEQQGAKGSLSRKYRTVEKQTEKKQVKYTENKLKALKARNEYLLCLDAANAAVNKYFGDDLPDLIDCMDLGYHNTLGRAMLMHVSAEDNIIQSRQACVNLMNKCIGDLEQRSDKHRFLELSHQPFAVPRRFDFQPHKGDEVCQISAQKPVQEELVDRLNQLNNRLNSLKVENDEIWKTLETVDHSLMEMINVKDYDVSILFNEERHQPRSSLEKAKKRSDRFETEDYYLAKFGEYMLSNNLIARLQGKVNSIQKALGEGDYSTLTGIRPPSLPPKPLKRKIGRAPLVGQPKLFGGCIEEYVEATGHDIPLVVRSCIRSINLHGMHHQGVFRVSGSQHEINEFKNCFERGDDPLLDVVEGRDINSVAGVLKLYFRELREPLFPIAMFDDFIACIQMKDLEAMASRLKELIISLPRRIITVMAFLFAFLHHLSEYSDENMMDPYNLAICFGPTLMPVPPDLDQVQYHSYVNEVIKNVILHQDDIYPHGGSTAYEKCIIEDEVDRDEDGLDNLSEDEEEDDMGDVTSEDATTLWTKLKQLKEAEVKEGIAQYDFTARTERELTFKKGDVLALYHQVSPDWWEGHIGGKDGLIPDKYIASKTGEKKSSVSRSVSGNSDKKRSTESLPTRACDHSSKSLADCADISNSQPNITVPSASQSAFCLSASAVLVESPHRDGEALAVMAEVAESEAQAVSTEDLAQDIDTVLAEVMSGLESLQMNQNQKESSKTDEEKSPTTPTAKPRNTPDLVQDLPVSSHLLTPSENCSIPQDTCSLSSFSSAELFADSNQSTLKKSSGGSTMPRSTTASFRSPHVTTTAETFSPMKRSYTTNTKIRAHGLSSRSRRERYSDPADATENVTGIVDMTPDADKPVWIGRTAENDPHLMASVSRPVAQPRPKPPVRVKPQVMKKPARSPEILKRLQGHKEAGDGVERSAESPP